MYPSLPRPYKGRYPFRLGTTSFIHPDHIVPNVEALGPYLDEIEITIFESGPASLPPPSDIADLGELSRRDGLRYNIHLPLDISLTAADEAEGAAAVSALRGVIDLTRSLDPTTWTLHLPYPEPDRSAGSRKVWQERTLRRLGDLFSGNPAPPGAVSLENLDYPPEWLDPFIERFNCAVCLDIGHLITNGYDWERAFADYLAVTSVVHLSGMEGGKDHKSLHLLPEADGRRLTPLLRDYTGSVMLEIFSFTDLLSSLDYFERIWQETREEGMP